MVRQDIEFDYKELKHMSETHTDQYIIKLSKWAMELINKHAKTETM